MFIKDKSNRLLLIKRRKKPNQGLWSPPGGKLEMSLGESPIECARREASEETGMSLKDDDLKLFGYVSEKNYSGDTHWLMFLVECKKRLAGTPPSINEGTFQFFRRKEIDTLSIPPSDHYLVWPFYDKRSLGFWGLRADCSVSPPDLKIEVAP